MDTTAKQMQMAFMFEEGGIADDGMNVDPVSGNEIPPGSLAKEVRDDVPAQLSEGEYVVPADVVRFYGVKFFEDLRGEAKRGLMDMEANGRIGGEPVAQTMANQTGGDLTPEEIAALEQVTGMAMGGAVQQQPQMADPYAQQQQMYQQQQYNQGGQVLYAQEGVDVDPGIDPYKPQFSSSQASMFAPGFLIDQTTGQTQPELSFVTLYSPNTNEIRTFNLNIYTDKQEYERLLSEGWTTEKVQTTTETTVGQDDDQPPAPTPVEQAPIDYSKMSDDQLKAAAKSFNMIATVGTALASTMGLPIAAIVNTGAAAKYNDLLDTMKSRGISTEGMERKGSIFGGESGLLDNLIDRSDTQKGNKKGADFGDTWLGDLLGFDGEAGVQGPGLRESFGGARRTSGTTSTPKKSSGNVGDDKPSSSAPTSSPRPISRPASVGSTVDTTDDARASRGTGSMSSGERASQSYQKQEDADYAIMNKGGMVKRRNTKKKK